MDDRLYTHAALSRVPQLALRFTSDPEAREARLINDPDIKFIPLPQPMTRSHAAEWLSAQPDCSTADWQAAIADELGD